MQKVDGHGGRTTDNERLCPDGGTLKDDILLFARRGVRGHEEGLPALCEEEYPRAIHRYRAWSIGTQSHQCHPTDASGSTRT